MTPLISILLAIALPVFAIWKTNHGHLPKSPYLFSIGSFLFCGLAIIMEIYTIKRRLFAGDIGGIQDTIDAVLMISGFLLTSTLVANLLLLGLSFETLKQKMREETLSS